MRESAETLGDQTTPKRTKQISAFCVLRQIYSKAVKPRLKS